MSFPSCLTRLVARRFALQLRKYRNVFKNAEKFHASASDDDIHIFTKTNTSSVTDRYTHISCGYGFTVLCTNQRDILVSSVMSTSQLGVHSGQGKVNENFTEMTLPFTKPDSQVLEISCGRLHTVVSTTEGLFAAGCNKLGQCGLGEYEASTHFKEVPWSTPAPVKQVVCGLDHTLILTEDGDIWSCGWGTDGQTGLGHTDEQRFLAPVKIPSEVKIDRIAAKADSCLALSKCGEVFSWGNSEYSQLGFSTEDALDSSNICSRFSMPQQLKLAITILTKVTSLHSIVDIAIGNSVGLALTDEGDVLTWGYGLLGNSSETCFDATPQKLMFLQKRIVEVHCGLDYYVLVTDDKEIFLWGKINRTVYSRLPTKVDLPSNITHISCGIDHMGVIIDGETS